MKKFIFPIICLMALILICGCDPNEANVPDYGDFANQSVSVAGDMIVADIYFYATYNLNEFFFYWDTDGVRGAEYLVRCKKGSFSVYKASAPGYYNILKYSGTPILNSYIYHLEFPLRALDPVFDPDFGASYWFYSMETRDRMPDSGDILFTIVG